MKSDLYISLSDSDYPELLKNIYDPPDKLYYQGNKKLLHHKNLLTVVGSRQVTDEHSKYLEKIITELKGSGLVIVSGLARGIDGLAHRYALDNNLATIAVLGSSLDENKIYPRQNIELAREIIKKDGLLLSENSYQTTTQIWHFPKRNRILAGLSIATLVISGAKKSGTLITAQVAIDEGRDVLALSLDNNSELNKGPQKLIDQGAIEIQSGKDILEIYNFKQK